MCWLDASAEEKDSDSDLDGDDPPDPPDGPAGPEGAQLPDISARWPLSNAATDAEIRLGFALVHHHLMKVHLKSASDVADSYQMEKEKGDRWAQKLPITRCGIRQWLQRQLRVDQDLYIGMDVCSNKECATVFRGEHEARMHCPDCNASRYKVSGDPSSGV